MLCREQFLKQKYLNLETFRKSGAGVKTPVWFVLDKNKIYVQTKADSGKVKRVRKNELVQIAPCKVDGTRLGDWIAARSHEVQDPAKKVMVDGLLNKKYGLIKILFSLSNKHRNMKNTILEIIPG